MSAEPAHAFASEVDVINGGSLATPAPPAAPADLRTVSIAPPSAALPDHRWGREMAAGAGLVVAGDLVSASLAFVAVAIGLGEAERGDSGAASDVLAAGALASVVVLPPLLATAGARAVAGPGHAFERGFLSALVVNLLSCGIIVAGVSSNSPLVTAAGVGGHLLLVPASSSWGLHAGSAARRSSGPLPAGDNAGDAPRVLAVRVSF